MKKSYKIIYLGDSSVGKTSLICNYLTSGMQNQEPTVGIDFFSANMQIELKNGEEKTVNFQLWDTAGQERFRSLIKFYLRNSYIAVIVYAIDNRKSFENLKMWVGDFKKLSGNDSNIIIVANKSDLKSVNEECSLVSNEEGQEYADKINARFCSASALKKNDIEDVILNIKALIAEDILENPNLENDVKSTVSIQSEDRRSCC